MTYDHRTKPTMDMSVWRIAVISVCSLLLPTLAVGQEMPSSVTVGTRVRVAIPDAAPQRRTALKRSQEVRGEVTRLAGDTMFVRPAPRLGELSIPLGDVRRLDVSLGPPRRSTSAVLLGFEQATMMALAGALLYTEGEREFGVANRGEAAAVGAGVGFVSGAIIGAIAPFERWRRVRLPAQR